MEKSKYYLGEMEPVIERLAGLEELLLIVEDTALSEKIKAEMLELRKKYLLNQ